MIIRLILGYALFFSLGPFGAHRFFLKRHASAITLLLLSTVTIGWGAGVVTSIDSVIHFRDPAFLAELEGSSEVRILLALVGLVGLWWLADLILVAIIVLKDAEQEEIARKEAAAPQVFTANMDPSFQATRRAAGLETEASENSGRRSALPEEYVMPWRQDDARGAQKTYKPGEE